MYEIYTIKNMDTLDIIANKFNTTIDDLNRINGFDINDEVIEGLQMIVPAIDKGPYKYYTVKKGDNMYDIANKNNLDYKMLLQLNGLDEEDYIYPNQTIIIPKDGIKIYVTQDGDTVEDVINRFNVSIDELISENDKIYLRPEQIIVFRKK